MLLKNILVITCFGFLVSFNLKHNLETDKILLETFNDDELNDIINLIDYVDKLVKAETKSDDVNNAYHLYFNKLKKGLFDDNYIVPINSDEKFKFLESINEGTFNEFWRVYSIDIDTSRYKSVSQKALSLNTQGKYASYIGKLGETDSSFYYIHDNAIAMGDISRLHIIIYLADNKLDFNLIKNRLLAVVCIFSISEPIEKRED